MRNRLCLNTHTHVTSLGPFLKIICMHETTQTSCFTHNQSFGKTHSLWTAVVWHYHTAEAESELFSPETMLLTALIKQKVFFLYAFVSRWKTWIKRRIFDLLKQLGSKQMSKFDNFQRKEAIFLFFFLSFIILITWLTSLICLISLIFIIFLNSFTLIRCNARLI